MVIFKTGVLLKQGYAILLSAVLLLKGKKLGKWTSKPRNPEYPVEQDFRFSLTGTSRHSRSNEAGLAMKRTVGI